MMNVNRLVVGEIALGASVAASSLLGYLACTDAPQPTAAAVMRHDFDTCLRELPTSISPADENISIVPVGCADKYSSDFYGNTSVSVAGKLQALTQAEFRSRHTNDEPGISHDEAVYNAEGGVIALGSGGLAAGLLSGAAKVLSRRKREFVTVNVPLQQANHEADPVTRFEDLRPNTQAGASKFAAKVKIPKMRLVTSPEPDAPLTQDEKKAWLEITDGYRK